MTNKNYYTLSNYETINTLPSRDEFHKFASNELSLGDFCTNHPSGYQIARVDQSIRWTIANDRGQLKRQKGQIK